MGNESGGDDTGKMDSGIPESEQALRVELLVKLEEEIAAAGSVYENLERRVQNAHLTNSREPYREVGMSKPANDNNFNFEYYIELRDDFAIILRCARESLHKLRVKADTAARVEAVRLYILLKDIRRTVDRQMRVGRSP